MRLPIQVLTVVGLTIPAGVALAQDDDAGVPPETAAAPSTTEAPPATVEAEPPPTSDPQVP